MGGLRRLFEFLDLGLDLDFRIRLGSIKHDMLAFEISNLTLIRPEVLLE